MDACVGYKRESCVPERKEICTWERFQIISTRIWRNSNRFTYVMLRVFFCAFIIAVVSIIANQEKKGF